jgi:hypothetical protein
VCAGGTQRARVTIRDDLFGIGPAARRCLVAGTPAEMSAPRKGSSCWEAESDLLEREGLADTAVVVLRQDRGELTPHDRGDPLKRLVQASRIRTMHTLAAATFGEDILLALEAAQIRYAVVKGPAVARLYPEGWPRSYSDIDVVVDPSDFSNALGVAAERQWTPAVATLPQWHGFYRWCREGTNLHDAGWGNVDVHHHLPPWCFGRTVTTSEIIDRAEPPDLQHPTRLFARAEDLALVSALHGLNDIWKGKLGLQAWRDFIVLGFHCGPERTYRAFERAKLLWLLELLSDLMAEIAPGHPISGEGWTTKSPRSRPKPRAVAAAVRLQLLGWSTDWRVTSTQLSWVARLPLAGALFFIVGSAIPSRSYIRQVDGSYRTYWSRTVREIGRQHGSIP